MSSGLGSGETCCYWNRTWTWEDWWISEHKCVDHNERWLCNEIDTTQSWIAKCVICSRVESAYCIGLVNLVGSVSLWTLQCCCVSSLHRGGDIMTVLSMSLQTWNGTVSWAWTSCFRLCDWRSEYDSGVCNAAVSPDVPDVRSNWFDELPCWHKPSVLVWYKIESNQRSILWIGFGFMAAKVAVLWSK